MEKSTLRFHLGLAVIFGSVWGLSEAALGMGIRACAANISGSVMTAVALFFIALGWAATRRWFVPILIVLIASLFKLFDALILDLPVLHGAIANPIFAFWTQIFAFILLVAVLGQSRFKSRSSRMWLGGGSALMAVSMFPLVGFATTVPACVFAGTAVPLSIVFAPLAILLSILTVPLGFYVADQIQPDNAGLGVLLEQKVSSQLISTATLVVSLLLVFLIRVLLPVNMS